MWDSLHQWTNISDFVKGLKLSRDVMLSSMAYGNSMDTVSFLCRLFQKVKLTVTLDTRPTYE